MKGQRRKNKAHALSFTVRGLGVYTSGKGGAFMRKRTGGGTLAALILLFLLLSADTLASS